MPPNAPDFVKNVTGDMIDGKGDSLPVSAIPVDGTWPSGTTQYEKRNIAVHIPVWEPDICIQCGTCSFVCPHATIRIKAYDPALLKDAPATFKSTEAKGKEMKGLNFTVQVAPEDCTGCGSCVSVCPAQKKDAREEDPRLQGDQHGPTNLCASRRRRTTTSSSACLRPIFRSLQRPHSQGKPVREARLRVQRRLRRVRRDALHKAAHPTVRRPSLHRECDGLLLHLRRATCRRPPIQRGPTAGGRPGRTRSSRTTQSLPSAWGRR